MTLVFNCEIAFQPNGKEAGSAIGNKVTVLPKTYVFIIFDAKTPEGPHCKNWDNELMLIQDVEMVKCPDGIIPIPVGFYIIPNQIADFERGLLFEFTKGGFKFLPAFTDWKCCPFLWGSPKADYGLSKENIKSASEVVNSVTNDQRGLAAENFILVNCKAKVVLPSVNFYAHGVRIETAQPLRNFIEFEHVLLGPCDL